MALTFDLQNSVALNAGATIVVVRNMVVVVGFGVDCTVVLVVSHIKPEETHIFLAVSYNIEPEQV